MQKQSLEDVLDQQQSDNGVRQNPFAVDVQAEPVAEEPGADIDLYHDGLPFDADRVCRRIQSCGAIILENMVQIGKDLIWAKRVMDYGEFTHWLRVHVGMDQQRASEFMRIAQRVLHSTTPQTRQFLSQASGGGKKKLLSLLDISDEEIDEAMDEGAFRGRPLDEVEAMSVRELRAALRTEKDRNSMLRERNEASERRAIRAQADLERERSAAPHSEMPHTAILRGIAALSEIETEICHWIEENPTAEEWLALGGVAADPSTLGIINSLITKAEHIKKNLLTPIGVE